MSDLMQFPETWEEFEASYGFTDSDEVYTNGARLIPSFRVEQWLEHTGPVKHGKWTKHILKNANVPWGYDCSACDGWFVVGEDVIKKYHFCPNCGARMDSDG